MTDRDEPKCLPNDGALMFDYKISDIEELRSQGFSMCDAKRIMKKKCLSEAILKVEDDNVRGILAELLRLIK